jgi:cell division protein FtsI/penicillin-binding protein 2
MVFAAVLLLLIARLFHLQVIEHEHWTETARNSRIGQNTIPFQRGRILDRNGAVLATDRQAYDLYFRYRDFRRGFVAAQLLEALRLLDYPQAGLVDCLQNGEQLGEWCLSLKPENLEGMATSHQDDLRFYLTGLTGNRSFARRVAIQDWFEQGNDTFADAFPEARAYFHQRLVEARHNLQFLENLLEVEEPGSLLQRLEDRRQQLEVMVARAALQGAAARVYSSTASWIRQQLSQPGEVREEMLSHLHERWQLDGTLAHFGTVLAPLPKRYASIEAGQVPTADQQAYEDFQQLQHLQQAEVVEAVLNHLRTVALDDVSGVKRAQTARIHRLRVIALERDLDFELVDLLSQQADDYPGLYLQQVTQRIYPLDVARMVIGSLRLPTEDDLVEDRLRRDRFQDLRRQLFRTDAEEAEFRRLRDWWWSESLAANERKGQDGIEMAYEPVLRGSRGYLQELEGGADGELPLELLFSPPQNGVDIRLSLDAGMIAAAERVITKVYRETVARLHTQQPTNLTKALQQFDPEAQRVGFVIMDIESGEVPVLVSMPTVSRQEIRDHYNLYRDMKDGTPLRNRALGGGFYGNEQPYPGSTFKPMVAAAALNLDPTIWNRRYSCLGAIKPSAASKPIHCDNRTGHGEIDMREALKKSCNVYFYELGDDLGAEILHDTASKLGFDSVFEGTGHELSVATRLERQANYLAPLKDLQRDILKRMRTSIGQVGVRASPLQMARLFGWLASGELVRPKLVLEGGGATPASAPLPQMDISWQTRDRITEALSAVVYEIGGTAHRTEFPERWQIVGKTGTAEVAKNVPTHAWFTGYFPADQPRYAFAVLCENTGLHGGQIASYILKDFLFTEEGKVLLGEQASVSASDPQETTE